MRLQRATTLPILVFRRPIGQSHSFYVGWPPRQPPRSCVAEPRVASLTCLTLRNMSVISSRARCSLAGVLAIAILSACSDAPRTTSPRVAQFGTSNRSTAVVATSASAAPAYLACPSTVAQSTSAVIGPKGGVLTLDGSALAVPPGAVPVPTTFTFTLPASDLMQVEVHADGVEHYVFKRPVAVTVDYSRCAAAADPIPQSFGAWYFDPQTRKGLQFMGGVDIRALHRVVFATNHLSGYAISELAPSDPGSGLMY